MAQDPTTDRTTIASWSEELLDTTVDRVSLRERLLRMRRMAPRVAMVAVAAATSYLIARYAVGHPRPFFAPIATVVVLGITLGQRTKRALQLAVGVALGVLVADLVVQLIGTGAWQIAVIVFLGMMAVVFLGGDQMVVVQAANAGVLIAVLAIPGDPTGLSRFIDALIGASTALVFNLVLFPVNPLKLAAGALEPAVNRLGAVMNAVPTRWSPRTTMRRPRRCAAPARSTATWRRCARRSRRAARPRAWRSCAAASATPWPVTRVPSTRSRRPARRRRPGARRRARGAARRPRAARGDRRAA